MRELLGRCGLWPFRLISEPALWFLRKRYGARPVPIRILLGLRRFAFGVDPLARHPGADSAARVEDAKLSGLLTGLPVGEWALGSAAINELTAAVDRHRPPLVLEFGSGTSTLCLAYLTNAHPPAGGVLPIVVSVEQDAAHVERTIAILESAGLDGNVTVLHAPVGPRLIGDRAYSSYELPSNLGEAFQGRKASLVVVDGPAAENGAQFATIVVAREWLAPGAVILLDDGLRDGELDTARRWSESGWLRVRGMVLVDKGMLQVEVRS